MIVGELVPAFSFGVLATLSPCSLPLYPGFLAYLAAGGQGRTSGLVARILGVFVLAGVLTTMLAFGALLSVVSSAAGQVVRGIVTPVADLIVVGIGVALLLGLNPFARLPTVSIGTGSGGGALSAYVYGLLYGPIAFPCTGALIISIFTLSFTLGSFLEKMAFFLAFGLGFGLPLLVISLLAQERQAALLRAFSRNYAVIGRLAGALLVAVGAWDFWVNLPSVLLYLGA